MRGLFSKVLLSVVFLAAEFFAWSAPPPPAYLDKHSFGDDTPILSTALSIDQQEYQRTIEAGVRERMQVYFHLFKTMVLQEKFPKEIEKIIPQKTVERILTEEGFDLAALRELYKGKEAKDINLFYGPDLIKSDTGTWYALEDNFGTGMGGLGDAQLIHDDFKTRHQISEERQAIGDFKDLFENFYKANRIDPKKSRVIAFVPPDEIPDEYTSYEYTRLKNLFTQIGVEVMDPNELSEEQKAALLKNPPAAIINTVDPIDDSSRDFIYQEFFKKRKTPLYISPGSITLSNKGFLPFINPLAKHLGFGHSAQYPLVLSSPDSIVLDKALPKDLEDWVIKEAYGASGDQVYLPKFMSNEERQELARHFKKSKGIFIAQRLITSDRFSTPFGSFIYDIRPLVHLASGEHTYVTPTPWARASQTNKVNISKGGANLVITQGSGCSDLFH